MKVSAIKINIKNCNLLVTGLLLILLATACTAPDKGQGKTNITVSIMPQKFFIERIAGDDFKINVLIPPGASPETYDPTPRQIGELYNSAAYLKSGYLELEVSWLTKIAGDIPGLELVDTSEGVALIEEDSDDHHEGIEPHIWMSARNAMVISTNIRDYFILHFPDKKEQYEANYLTLVREIENLDRNTAKLLEENEVQSFLIYHPALTYYARDYGLEQISIEHHGKEPSASFMAQIIELIKEKKISSILVQKQFDKTRAEIIARETGIRIKQIDPLDYDWIRQYETITDIICGN